MGDSVPDVGASPGDREPLAVVLVLLGDLFRIEKQLCDTLESVLEARDTTEVVVVLDGPMWECLPMVQRFGAKLRTATRTWLPGATILDHLGALLNRALPHIGAPYFTVLLPGTTLRPEHGIKPLHRALAENTDAGLASARLLPEADGVFREFAPRINHGHIQMANLVPLSGTVYRTAAVREVGGWDTRPNLQRFAGWEMALKLTRTRDYLYQPPPTTTATSPPWDTENFPFIRTVPVRRSTAQSLLLKACVPAPRETASLAREEDTRAPQNLKELQAAWQGIPWSELHTPIRALVTGGFWEPAHNQLCFFNHFETSPGMRHFDWITRLDTSVTEDDLDEMDLVILSRGRSANIPRVLDICERRRIPTLYMIDDNWLTVGRDWPAYRSLFSPGVPDYEVFLEALRRATATLVYTERMEQAVTPHARSVYRIDVNIDLTDTFEERPGRKGFRIGFAGSPRESEAAFAALREFLLAHPHPDVEAVFCGAALPAALDDLCAAGRVRRQPWASYSRYRQTLARLQPDVLIAPLDSTDFSQSKCPNKFLEITAVGAVGVYSAVEPYAGLIENERHGLLISEGENENREAWYAAYTRLYRQPQLRHALLAEARHLVRNRFATPRVYPQFLAVVNAVLGRSSLASVRVPARTRIENAPSRAVEMPQLSHTR